MSEGAKQDRLRSTKWVMVMVSALVLVVLAVLFWDWVATEVFLRMAASNSAFLTPHGFRGLRWLGPRAVPHLIPHLSSSDIDDRQWCAGLAVAPYWGSLSPAELRAAAPGFLRAEVNLRPYYERGSPVRYRAALVPLVQPGTALNVLEHVELMERGQTVASLEIPRSGPHLDLAAEPGSEELVARLQELGPHQLRFSLSLVDGRLPRPLFIGRVTHTVTTVEKLPLNYFTAVTSPAIDEAMKQAISLAAVQSSSAPAVQFHCTNVRNLPAPFYAHVWVRVRERGELVDNRQPFKLLPGDRTHIARDLFFRDLPLEPDKTYHLQIVLRPDRDLAWLDPYANNYWDGELESEWVEVTVPAWLRANKPDVEQSAREGEQ